MQGVNVWDYFEYTPKEYREIEAKRDQAQLEARQTTAQEYLQAAYDFNPSATGTDPNDTKLVQLTVTKCVPVVPIGRIYGETSVWLTVTPNPLRPSKIKASYFTNLPIAVTDAGAISYPDGHPSEADSEDSSKGVLSRFWPLGYLIYKHPDGDFVRTGHVLVMDMEPSRDHHPWIVLASEWADINGDGSDGMFLSRPSAADNKQRKNTDFEETKVTASSTHPHASSLTLLTFVASFLVILEGLRSRNSFTRVEVHLSYPF